MKTANDYTLYMHIGRMMMDYDKRFKSYVKTHMSKHALGFAEAMTMLSLLEQPKQNAESLLSSVSYDKSVMTRTLQQLESKNLVARQPNPEDGRSYLFDLTEDGKAAIPVLIEILSKWTELAFEGITEENIVAMHDSLREIQQNIREKK